MIVVDTNVIVACLLMTSEHAVAARRLLEIDREWLAPVLWRSEFGNVLATGQRTGGLDRQQAQALLSEAESIMRDGEYSISSADVLELASESGCTYYDCEFVALARDLDLPLVTLDRAVLRAFPDVAVSPDTYLQR